MLERKFAMNNAHFTTFEDFSNRRESAVRIRYRT